MKRDVRKSSKFSRKVALAWQDKKAVPSAGSREFDDATAIRDLRLRRAKIGVLVFFSLSFSRSLFTVM